MQALQYNTIGMRNTATGVSALYFNDDGNDNAAFGQDALLDSKNGSWNTAIGKAALQHNFDGNGNTAVGLTALWNNKFGDYNTAIGYGAGPGAGLDNLTNTTAVGYNAVTDAPDQIRLGNSAVKEVLPGFNSTNASNGVSLGSPNWRWKVVYSCNGMVQCSDGRLKSNVVNTHYGLADVMRLRPVQYHWKNNPDSDMMLGFIAQEVESIVPEAVVIPKNEEEDYAMQYDALIPVLTRAIQEQQAQIEALKAQNEQITQQNQCLQTQLDALRADVQAIRAAIGQQPALNAESGTK
jgi:hypothetical protein